MLKTWPLIVGYACPREFLVRPGGSWRRCRLPARCLLFRHPEHGDYLWDTGYGPAYLEATRHGWSRLLRWLIPADLNGPDLLDQLHSLGVEPSRLAGVGLSHFHPDHIGSLAQLGQVPLYGLASEWQRIHRMSRWQRLATGHLDGLLQGLEPRPFEALPRRQWPGWEELGPGYDWLGDGSARIFALPGHTPGQLGLYLERTPRPLFWVADAYYLPAQLDGQPLPWPTRRAVEDPPAYRATLEKLRLLRARHPQVEFVSSHQPEASSFS